MWYNISKIFQSTLPVRGATGIVLSPLPSATISIHAPRAGSDLDDAEGMGIVAKFQSTLPVRGATAARYYTLAQPLYFNPRSPCGERRHIHKQLRPLEGISIHAPRAGSDQTAEFITKYFDKFQSTLPVRGATCAYRPQFGNERYFNPRSPCGERRDVSLHLITEIAFQSTLPVRGATEKSLDGVAKLVEFQSTLPVRGATPPAQGGEADPSNFNPRSPCGERPYRVLGRCGSLKGFQSTLPVRGATI